MESGMTVQQGVLAPLPAQARYLTFDLKAEQSPRRALQALAALADGEQCVVGLGRTAIAACGAEIEGLREFPSFSGRGFSVPSTPAALWCWLRGDDRGDLVHLTHRIETALAPAFAVTAVVDAFRHGKGQDLSGYEDGTENPKGKKAVAAAVAAGRGAGLDGSSFVAVQQWAHDFPRFEAMSSREQDHAVGRRRRDNVELENAPASAHVKRTAQENFTPEAFVLRRSMPWADAARAGLMFVSFGKSVDAFEAQLRRMVGADDGIVDAIFKFTQPLTGCYFWCPPLRNGRLDLRAILKE
jgi:putative iron-dependent peroxidase